MLRRFLIVLVFIFFTLLVTLPVLLGGYVLAQAAEDSTGSAVFRISTATILVVLAIVTLLMVATLALINSQP